MNEAEAARIMDRLQGYYGPAKEEVVRQYGRVLRTMPYAKADAAVNRCIDSCTYFPKVAEFLKAAGKGADLGDHVYDGPTYQAVEEERTMEAPFNWLNAYDECPCDCHPCDGTMGGKVPKGCCAGHRWKIVESVRWYQRHKKTIPRHVVEWMEKRGLAGTGVVQENGQGTLDIQDIRL